LVIIHLLGKCGLPLEQGLLSLLHRVLIVHILEGWRFQGAQQVLLLLIEVLKELPNLVDRVHSDPLVDTTDLLVQQDWLELRLLRIDFRGYTSYGSLTHVAIHSCLLSRISPILEVTTWLSLEDLEGLLLRLN
jgi:hypothetical protein